MTTKRRLQSDTLLQSVTVAIVLAIVCRFVAFDSRFTRSTFRCAWGAWRCSG